MTLYSAIGSLVKTGGGEDGFWTADWSEEAGQCVARPCPSTKKCGASRFLIRTRSWASLQLGREQGLSDSEAAVELLFSTVRARETFTFCRSAQVAHQVTIATAIERRCARDALTANATQK